MATITIGKGLDEYALRLSRLESECEGATKQAVYAGAAVVADAIKSEMKGLPIDNKHGTSSNKVNGVTPRQKSDLINGFGLAPMENKSGYIQTKAGFNGYGSTPTAKYPKGVPNQILARSVNSGSSFRTKNAFVRRAVNRTKQPSIKAMGNKIDELCMKIMN